MNASSGATEAGNLTLPSPHPPLFNLKNKITFGKHPRWVFSENSGHVCPMNVTITVKALQIDGGEGVEWESWGEGRGSGNVCEATQDGGGRPVCLNSSRNTSGAPSWGATRHQHPNVDVNASGRTLGWSGESCHPASHQPDGLVQGGPPLPSLPAPCPHCQVEGWSWALKGVVNHSPPRTRPVLCESEIIRS